MTTLFLMYTRMKAMSPQREPFYSLSFNPIRTFTVHTDPPMRIQNDAILLPSEAYCFIRRDSKNVRWWLFRTENISSPGILLHRLERVSVIARHYIQMNEHRLGYSVINPPLLSPVSTRNKLVITLFRLFIPAQFR